MRLSDLDLVCRLDLTCLDRRRSIRCPQSPLVFYSPRSATQGDPDSRPSEKWHRTAPPPAPSATPSTTSSLSTVSFASPLPAYYDFLLGLPISFESPTNRIPFTEKGDPYPLAGLRGKVVLVVNTASKCGFTPQFTALESLYKKVSASHPDSFLILGFPCNQFNSQDPGSNDTIQDFCQKNYGVSFPVLGKTNVNGDKAEPVWEWMKSERPGILGIKRIKWNFEKFLIGSDGKVKGRWASTSKPESLEGAILEELKVGKSGL